MNNENLFRGTEEEQQFLQCFKEPKTNLPKLIESIDEFVKQWENLSSNLLPALNKFRETLQKRCEELSNAREEEDYEQKEKEEKKKNRIGKTESTNEELEQQENEKSPNELQGKNKLKTKNKKINSVEDSEGQEKETSKNQNNCGDEEQENLEELENSISANSFPTPEALDKKLFNIQPNDPLLLPALLKTTPKSYKVSLRSKMLEAETVFFIFLTSIRYSHPTINGCVVLTRKVQLYKANAKGFDLMKSYDIYLREEVRKFTNPSVHQKEYRSTVAPFFTQWDTTFGGSLQLYAPVQPPGSWIEQKAATQLRFDLQQAIIKGIPIFANGWVNAFCFLNGLGTFEQPIRGSTHLENWLMKRGSFIDDIFCLFPQKQTDPREQILDVKQNYFNLLQQGKKDYF